MTSDTKCAPFNAGDHVRYVGSENRSLPAGVWNEREDVLTAGMEGVIILSSGTLAEEDESDDSPWHCRVQFHNGYQLDITPDTASDFELTSVTV